MAHDDRNPDRERGRDRWREEEESPRAEWRERDTRWQGGDSFGGGWGNQTADYKARDWDEGRSLGDRSFGDDRGPDIYSGGPGFAPDFPGQHREHTTFGRPRNVGYLSSPRGYGFRSGHAGQGDPHYSEWRDRQIASLDRDYDEYRREKQSRFDREFGAWRDKRCRQRDALDRVNEHMEVIGSDGGHIGTVDCVRGEHIVLTKSDPAADGIHHSIPCAWIEEVGEKVNLNLSADEAKERWRTERRNRALFEREDSGSRGPHMLNRAFSGTYPKER